MAIQITPQMYWDEVKAWLSDGRADDDSTDGGPFDEHDSPDELPAQLRSMTVNDAKKWVEEAIQLCPDLEELGPWLCQLVYTVSLTDNILLMPGSAEEKLGKELGRILKKANVPSW